MPAWSGSVELCSPRSQKFACRIAVLRYLVNRTALTGVISFLLLAAGGAWCQSESPSVELAQRLHFDGSNVPEVQRPEPRTQTSLPDAPSVQPPTQAEKFHAFFEEARSPLTLGAVAINVGVMRAEEEHLAPGMQPSFTALYRVAVLVQRFFWQVRVSVVAQAGPPLSPFDQQQHSGQGRLRSFARFDHAQRLRKKNTEHLVFPRGADFSGSRHCLSPILEAILFDHVQRLRFDHWQRRGDKRLPRVLAWHPANAEAPYPEVCEED